MSRRPPKRIWLYGSAYSWSANWLAKKPSIGGEMRSKEYVEAEEVDRYRHIVEQLVGVADKKTGDSTLGWQFKTRELEKVCAMAREVLKDGG